MAMGTYFPCFFCNFVEFERHKQKTVKHLGCDITISASGRYSYNHSPEWTNLNKERKELEKKMQAAYKTKLDLVDNETGEIIPMAEYTPNVKSLRIS